MGSVKLSTKRGYVADWDPKSITSSGTHTVTYMAALTIRRLPLHKRVGLALRRLVRR